MMGGWESVRTCGNWGVRAVAGRRTTPYMVMLIQAAAGTTLQPAKWRDHALLQSLPHASKSMTPSLTYGRHEARGPPLQVPHCNCPGGVTNRQPQSVARGRHV